MFTKYILSGKISPMKAIFVESLNGYLAHSANDDMLWTPSLDKKIFKLLSFAFGGVYVCSQHTYSLLPDIMRGDKNRQFVIADKTGEKSLTVLNKKYPNGVLIGGPRFLTVAYNSGVIDTFIITTVNKNIPGVAEYKNPFTEILAKQGANCEIKFPDMVVRVYKNNSRGR